MPQIDPTSPEIERINKGLAEWRQGDLALKENWFMYVADPSKALTEESGQAEGDLQAINGYVDGLVVITQSCDIIRSCKERPFLDVVPLVEVDPLTLLQIEKGQRPAYAFIPATADRRLVAYLDKIMTVEKAVATTWTRTQGCRTEVEVQRLAQSLARKWARFAFPNDFTEYISTLVERIKEKHDRQSKEGNALRSLSEIRLMATPSWNANRVKLFIWFIRNEVDQDIEGQPWEYWLNKWLDLISPRGRFTQIEGVVVSLEDLTAKDYVESVPLDLDYLSTHGI